MYSKTIGLLGGVVLLVASAHTAYASGVELCISSTATQFCIDSTGHSNKWWADPSNTLASFDLLGDSEQYFSYVEGGIAHSAWLSAFSIVNETAVVGGGLQSTITDPLGNVQIVISTDIESNNIRETFTVKNISANGDNITATAMAEYFQYFPYGAGNPDKGTLNYEKVPTIENTEEFGLWGRGAYGETGFIRSGGACGGPTTHCTTPDSFVIGLDTDVKNDILATDLTTPTPIGLPSTPGSPTNLSDNPGHIVGALYWTNTNALAAGDSQTYTVELVPEPATVGFMLIGAAVLAIKKRRK